MCDACTDYGSIISVYSSEVIRDPPDALFAKSAIVHAVCMHMRTSANICIDGVHDFGQSWTLVVCGFAQILTYAGHVRRPTCDDRTMRTLYA